MSLHYNGNESYLYIDGEKQCKFKQYCKFSDAKILLGNITDQLSSTEAADCGFNGEIYHFSLDHKERKKKETKKIH